MNPSGFRPNNPLRALQFPRIHFLALFLFVAVGEGPLHAATVTLQPSADTSLFEFNPNNNLGGEAELPIGTGLKYGKRNRGLFKFELASKIPTNAVVTSVTFTLRVTGSPPTPVNSKFELHRVLVAWGEGNKKGRQGSPATKDEVTWLARFFQTSPWNQTGAAAPKDFSASVSAATLIRSDGSYTFGSTSNLVTDVQAWLADPPGNFGWIVLSDSESVPGTARRVASRETTNPSFVPKLVVEFSGPAASTPPQIEQPKRVGDQFQFSFTTESKASYTVEFLNAFSGVTPFGWSVLTNLTAPSTNVVVTDSIVSHPARFYRVRSP